MTNGRGGGGREIKQREKGKQEGENKTCGREKAEWQKAGSALPLRTHLWLFFIQKLEGIRLIP